MMLAMPLTLPCGVQLKNRLAKSATSETLGTRHHGVGPLLAPLYRRWAEGGTGLGITGNVMVDRRHTAEPGNVVVEDRRDLQALRAWAEAGRENGAQLWMQINHPGKQSPRVLSRQPVSASAIPFSDPNLKRFFAVPRALTEAEIHAVIRRFATTAAIAREAGFGGVQIHGAHGYLVSQFLSPLHNQRQDDWGGPLSHRMRFVSEVYQAIRAEVGRDFPVSIKLNSADFQRGGFTEEESLTVVEHLAALGMDLIEISGGTYERPAMATGLRESSRQREAYFLDYAERVRDRVSVPLMVTGGFRTRQGMEQALEQGATDLIGLARPLLLDPEFSRGLLQGQVEASEVRMIRTGIPIVDRMAMMEVSWYELQMARLARGRPAGNPERGLLALLQTVGVVGWRRLRMGRMRA